MHRGRARASVLALAGCVALTGCKAAPGGSHARASAHRALPASVRVAVLEFNPVLGAKKANQDRLARAIDSAMTRGARLVVTPEMSNTGYTFSERREIARLVEPIPGPWTRRLSQVAAAHHGYIATSMPEVDPRTGLYYISAVLVGPDGVIGVYRKNHPWQQEELWAARGDRGVPVFSTPLGRIAFNICMDTVFWETPRVAALEGADILIVPTNSSGQTVSLFQTIAAENGVYVIGANRAGDERGFHMVGLSGVWSPDGDKLGLSPLLRKGAPPPAGTREVWATIHPALARARRAEVMAARRPALYALTQAYAPLHPRPTPALPAVTGVALQIEPAAGQVSQNLDRLAASLDALAPAGRADTTPVLAVTPELAVTGPIDSAARTPRALARLAAAAGAAVPRLGALARTHAVYLVAGTLQRAADGGFSDAALVFRPDGTLAGSYAKTHLGPGQDGWLTPGDAPGFFDLPGLGRLGVVLGDEARVPELVGALEVRRVDLIAAPSAIRAAGALYVSLPDGFARGAYAGKVPLWWDAAARFGQAYVVGANFTGQGYDGLSGVVGIDPIYGLDRPQLAAAGAPGLGARIDLARETGWWFNQQVLILLRRPELYRPLVEADPTGAAPGRDGELTRSAEPARQPASAAGAPG